VLDGLILLQERIQRGEGHSQVTIAAEAAARKAGPGYEPPLVSIRPVGQLPKAET
jgi:hypothetical protein